jgi:hypothetical protein
MSGIFFLARLFKRCDTCIKINTILEFSVFEILEVALSASNEYEARGSYTTCVTSVSSSLHRNQSRTHYQACSWFAVQVNNVLEDLHR